MKKIFYFLLVTLTVFGQQKPVQTSVDVTKNKIGAAFKLSFKTTVDTASRVAFPELKNFGDLEVIASYPIDTIEKDNQYELTKKYDLTQFEPGKYSIPSIKILINNKAISSDAIQVEVNDVVVDTLKQKMYDIKDIVPVQEHSNWWKYLLGFLLLGGIGVLGYWYYKKRQNREVVEEDVYRTPIQKATFLLNNLEKKELWQQGEVKKYYSELTDIVRDYIEEVVEIPAKESTTTELIEGLKIAAKKKKMKLGNETFESLLSVLKQADLVKFAKSKPMDFEIADDRKKIERSIINLDKSIPKIEENQDELLLNEMQRLEAEKVLAAKKRKNRQKTIIGVVVGAIIGIFVISVAINGFTNVIDTILGNSSKELLEGEWVTSEYGNPSVKISTPKVLTRMDISKAMPQEVKAMIKEMNSFGYGSFLGSFYIMVNTITPKQAVQADLSKGLEGALQNMKMMGAQDLISKQEDFQTPQGAKGLRGYGTFTKIDEITKTSTKVFYELLVFGENGGMQQIIILHEEGDQYANTISDKILDSVELQNAQQ